ncbi:MAG: Clp1/GlmU family protein [bacterium]
MNKSVLFPLKEPEGWESWGSALMKSGGTVFLLGNVDTGKTYLARFLYTQGRQAGLNSAILELDVGQSEFGPPMTCTLFSEGKAQKHYFIGRFSPQGAFWRCLTAAALLKKEAEKVGSDLIIVDTTGLVEGPAGIWFKRTKIEILRPDYIIAREKNSELQPILRKFSYRRDIKIFMDPIPQTVRRFSPPERAILREQKLRYYFQNAREYQISVESLALFPSVQFFEKETVQGTIVGLMDEEGWLIALGILLEGGKKLTLKAPVMDLGKIKAVEASAVKIFDLKDFIIRQNTQEQERNGLEY